jgi:membrane protease YdiL (CAAX protease family)
MTDESPTPPRYRSLRDVPWRGTDLLIGLTPLLLARGLEALAERGLIGEVPWAAAFAVNLLFMGWMLLFPLGTALYRGYRPRLPPARTVLIEGLVALPALLALWLVLCAGATVWKFATGEVPTPGSPLAGPSRAGAVLWVVLFGLVAVFYAPVSEEFMFRGMVYNSLARYVPRPAAVALQGVLFGFLHSYGWIHAVGASVIGIALGILYEYRRNLLAPVFLHTFQNAVAAAAAVALAVGVADQPVLGVDGEPGERGCRVTLVWPGSGAEEAGLRVGDEIRTCDGTEVRDVADLSNVVRSGEAGRTVLIEYVRDGEARTTRAVLKRRGR